MHALSTVIPSSRGKGGSSAFHRAARLAAARLAAARLAAAVNVHHGRLVGWDLSPRRQANQVPLTDPVKRLTRPCTRDCTGTMKRFETKPRTSRNVQEEGGKELEVRMRSNQRSADGLRKKKKSSHDGG